MSDPETDVAWVQSLAGATLESCQRALEEAVSLHDLRKTIQDAHRSQGREFYAQVRAPYELYALARLLHPKHVVEVGVSSGVSSAYFLQALEANGAGTLHSIDLPTQQKGTAFSSDEDSPVALPPGQGSGWAVPPHLRRGWDLRLGKSHDILPSLVSELDTIGIFLHDSEHTFENAMFEFTTVDPKIPPGGLFLADNTTWLDGALDEIASRRKVVAVYRKNTDLGGFRKP